jgi:hypothetical protein
MVAENPVAAYEWAGNETELECDCINIGVWAARRRTSQS